MGKKYGLISRISDEDFTLEVAMAESFNQVSMAIGASDGTGIVSIRKRVSALGLDISHFYTRGQSPSQKEGVVRISEEEILRKDSPYKAKAAKTAFRRFKSVPYVCNICGQLPEWMGKPLTLNFDHINGDNRDHRPSNLRWLCPHCHSQTDTFCGRNHKNPLRRKRESS